MLDVFNRDIFGTVSLTESINALPYVPSRLGQLGLFEERGVRTTTVIIEEKDGQLSLVQTSPRGTSGRTNSRSKRRARAFPVPHLALQDAVIADEVQGIRAFGSEDSTESYAQVVNDKLAEMKQDIEVTKEYHRAGAVNGIILDADGTEIANLFTEFNVVEKTFDFATEFTSGTDDGDLLQLLTDVTRYIRDALGADAFTRIHCLAGDVWFDKFVKHAEVRESYRRWNQGQFFREQKIGDARLFEWGDVTFENYRGKVGTRDFIDPDHARFFPVGVPRLFPAYNAPADYVETVNTLGLPYYAKRETMKFDKGVELEAQANPLHICTRPKTLVKGTS